MSQEASGTPSAGPEVVDVVVGCKNKGRKNSNVVPKERKSRVMSQDWLSLCDTLGEGQD